MPCEQSLLSQQKPLFSDSSSKLAFAICSFYCPSINVDALYCPTFVFTFRMKQLNCKFPYLLNPALSATLPSFETSLKVSLFCLCFVYIIRSVLAEFLINTSVQVESQKIFLLAEHIFSFSNSDDCFSHFRNYHNPKMQNSLQ